jgi:hypothetical protein
MDGFVIKWPLGSRSVIQIYRSADPETLQTPIHNAFDKGKYITKASGRGLDPGN